MSDELYQGAVAPDFFDLVISSEVGGLDLTTVSAATIEVLLPGGTRASWTASLVTPSATELTLRYAFPSTSPIPRAGTMVAYGHLTVPGGFIDSDPASKPIRGKFEVP